MALSIEQMMSDLGYTRAWVECGVITETFVTDQYAEWSKGIGRDTSHYRTGAFVAYLTGATELSNDLLVRLLKLEDGNGDTELWKDRAYRLINWLPLGQLEDLPLLFPGILPKSLTEHLFRNCTRRRIAAHGLQSQWSTIRESRDPQLLSYVVQHDQADPEMLEWLAANGTNRRTRNLAKDRLRIRPKKKNEAAGQQSVAPDGSGPANADVD